MAVINGTEGNDLLRGTPDFDVISGFGGNDVLFGIGDDWLFGGDGKDKIFIMDNSVFFLGGDGDDVVVSRGDRSADGQLGSGDDKFISSGGGLSAPINGGDGDDLMIAGRGPANFEGDDGNDRLIGGPGENDLSGGAGDDFGLGRDGPDWFFFFTGDDIAIGGTGNDLYGTSLSGFAGIDHNRIIGFQQGDDTIFSLSMHSQPLRVLLISTTMETACSMRKTRISQSKDAQSSISPPNSAMRRGQTHSQSSGKQGLPRATSSFSNMILSECARLGHVDPRDPTFALGQGQSLVSGATRSQLHQAS
ncbi:MAG: hypothetical protein OEN23_13915 [Paracoccaceae bacterium]|nr:hypothetical protein [Paracoccaceae bacterium]